jgi:predicted metal-binding membrane protein
VTAGVAGSLAADLGRRRRRSWTVLRAFARPSTVAVGAAVAVAWLLLTLAMTGVPAGAGSVGRPLLWICTPGMAGMGPGGGPAAAAAEEIGSASLAAGLPMWGLMAAAMMLPTALPALRHVEVNSLYWRRRRAALEFAAVFLAIWALFGALVLGPLASLLPTTSTLALAAALVLAAAWQLTPLKQRALRACHRSQALPPRGWRATAGVARFGLRNGGACLASCWALMMTMAAMGSGRLVWMAGLTGIVAVEKLSLKPVRTSRRVAALLGAAAIGCAAIALLA